MSKLGKILCCEKITAWAIVGARVSCPYCGRTQVVRDTDQASSLATAQCKKQRKMMIEGNLNSNNERSAEK